jgi:protein involved in polysaccharide export with SLBB domain
VVPSQRNSVSVRGNVVREGLIKYEEGRRVDYYLDKAGGVRDSTKNVYLTQATGATVKVTGGWFTRSPEVEDGAVIRVTREPPRQRDVDYAEIASNITQIVSSTLTVLVLVTRVFN